MLENLIEEKKREEKRIPSIIQVNNGYIVRLYNNGDAMGMSTFSETLIFNTAKELAKFIENFFTDNENADSN